MRHNHSLPLTWSKSRVPSDSHDNWKNLHNCIEFANAKSNIGFRNFVSKCILSQIAEELIKLDHHNYMKAITSLEFFLNRLKSDNECGGVSPCATQDTPMQPPDEFDVDMRSEDMPGDMENESKLESPLAEEKDRTMDGFDQDLASDKFSQLSIQDIICVAISVMSSRIEKLTLDDLGHVLPTIAVEFETAVDAGVSLGQDKNYVSDVIPYLLPERLVDRALVVLPSLPMEVISLLSDDEEDVKPASMPKPVLPLVVAWT
ncbi:unnamed protein product [Phytophthora fragariaefolia]|uniref:Unnamed protein product n=1 Tax=Phytophthora fragariaefolia TaxID=1490495 RepID=A0A9W7CKZ3_9STRA|nr:unnamed protein product [Phytophthora fragariaefolia]